MRSKSILSKKLDADTYRLLDISLFFLERYFGHTKDRADAILIAFIDRYFDVFDEDALHHDSSYRIAAVMHYLIQLNRPHSGLGDWLYAEGYHQTPAEAVTYFRENYFDRQ